jgi:YVTN family beta-propeller protein
VFFEAVHRQNEGTVRWAVPSFWHFEPLARFEEVIEEMRIATGSFLLALLAASAALSQELPTPALLVLHKGENAMAIVDPSTGKVLGRVPVGQDPHELTVSPDGKLAFATNYSGSIARGSNSISVIDLVARTELHHVELTPLSRPHGLWFADGKLYFTAEGSMAIGRYDPTTNKVDWVLGTGQDRTHMILVGKDQKIFTSNVSANTISIIEKGGGPGGPPGGPGGPPGGPGGPPGFGPGGPPGGGPPGGGPGGPPGGGPGGPPPGGPGGPGRPGGPGGPGGGPNWHQTVVPVGRGPEGFDLSPDGKQIWTAHMNDGQVSVIDVASKKVVKTIDAGARGANRLKFTPDGKLVLISELGGGGLVVLNVADGSVKKRIKLGRGASGILIVPDGSKAYVAMTGENAIAVIDLKTLEETKRLETGAGPDGMAWVEGKH